MTIISGGFFIFFLATLILYYTLVKWQWVILLFASYLFYAYFDLSSAIFLIATTVSTFYAGILIGRNNKTCDEMISKLNSHTLAAKGEKSLSVENDKTISTESAKIIPSKSAKTTSSENTKIISAENAKTISNEIDKTISTESAKNISAENDKTKTLSPEIEVSDKKSLKAKYKQKNKLIVTLALLLLFGMLAFFKYTGFIMLSVNRVLERVSTGGTLPVLDILLPLGISFYIFQSAGYLIDVYRGKYKADQNIAKFALFVSFFPQIIQGPIGRYDRLAKQFYAEHRFDYTVIKYGIQLILWGIFKKMIIADRAAVLVNEVFGNYFEHGGAVIFIGVIFYCIQIYCDFSGGIDVCRGIAQCFGIILDENFKRPFFSRSIAEFWQRWHITLGSWMRDYLFYPLSLSKPFGRLGKHARAHFGNRIGKMLPAYLATFIIFTVIGIWHGANWKYLAFGLYNGILITFAMILEPAFALALQKLHIDRDGRFWNALRLARTFLLVCIGRYFTRADSLVTALRMLKRTFTVPLVSELSSGVLLQLGLKLSDFVIISIAILVLLGAGLAQERGIEIRKGLEQKNAAIQVFVMLTALAVIILLGVYRQGYVASQFIYAQF